MVKRLIELSSENIYYECLMSCIEFCGIRMDTDKGKRILDKCLDARKRYCKECKISILIMPFSGKCVMEDSFQIKDKTINCSGLKALKAKELLGGYLYAVFIESIQFEEMSTLQRYFVDCWMSAYVDAGWKYVKRILVNEAKKDFYKEDNMDNIFLTECFAPGFNGMEICSSRDLFQLMNLSEHGLELHDNYSIKPEKNNIGIYLVEN